MEEGEALPTPGLKMNEYWSAFATPLAIEKVGSTKAAALADMPFVPCELAVTCRFTR